MRSGYLTTLAAAMGLMALFAVACSSEATTPPPRSTPVPTVAPIPTNTAVPAVAPVLPSSGLEEPEQEWVTRTESEELRLILATPDLAPGTRRFAMVLTDGSGIVAFPVVQVASYKYPDGSDATADREGPVETVLARYFGFPYGTRGIHVTELTFDEVGLWGIEASVPQPDGSVATIEVLMEVRDATMSVDVGEVPPLVDSLTLADVEDVSDLTTGSQRDESLYQISLADALQNGKPTVVVYASPAFCTNAVCGPQVEVLSNLSASYGDAADFVHVDLFSNPKEIQGDLTRAKLSPLLDEWGLVSQEWTFVMNRDGEVVGRFENFAPQAELEPSLESVLEADEPEPTATAVPPTATSEPEVTEPEVSKPEPAEALEFEVTFLTTWRDLFDQFEESEQSCIRDGVGDEQLEVILGQQVLAEGEQESWELTFIDCVDPATAKAIWLANLLATSDGLDEAGEACIRGLVADADIKAVIAADTPGASEEEVAVAAEFFGGLFECSLMSMLGDLGKLDGDEACLAELLSNADMSEFYLASRPDASPESAAKFEEFMFGLFACIPGLMQTAMEEAGNAPMPTQ